MPVSQFPRRPVICKDGQQSTFTKAGGLRALGVRWASLAARLNGY
jgi:hypothetical protein